MAVAIAAVIRRALAPARRRALWSAPWSADPEASATLSPSTSPDKKKKPPPSPQDRLGDVRDAVNERKLPPELRGRPNAVRVKQRARGAGPPVLEISGGVAGRMGGRQLRTGDDPSPDSLGEGAGGKEVTSSFQPGVAQFAGWIVWPSSDGQVVSS